MKTAVALERSEALPPPDTAQSAGESGLHDVEPVLSTAAPHILGLLKSSKLCLPDPGTYCEIPFKYQCSPLCAALAQSETLERLNGIRQMSISYCSRGEHGNHHLRHTRFEHSLDVAKIAAQLARSLGLDERTMERVALAGLFHDAAHPPFAHAGEEALRVLAPSGMRFFDHDEEVGNVLQRDEMRDLLNSSINYHRISAEEIVSDLSTPERFGVGYLVREIADRLAYLRMDFTGTDVLPAIHRKVLAAAETLESALSATEDGCIYLNSLSPTDRHMAMQRILLFRAVLFQEYSVHPQATLANEVITNALRNALLAGRVTAQEFIGLNDHEATLRFSSRDQEWLGQNSAQRKLDSYFRTAAWVRLGDLSPESANKIENRECREVFLRQLAETLGAARDDMVLGLTADYSKAAQYLSHTPDQQLECNQVSVRTALSRRFLFLAVSEDLQGDMARIRQLVTNLFAPELKESRDGTKAVIKYTNLLETDIDPKLFPQEVSALSDVASGDC